MLERCVECTHPLFNLLLVGLLCNVRGIAGRPHRKQDRPGTSCVCLHCRVANMAKTFFVLFCLFGRLTMSSTVASCFSRKHTPFIPSSDSCTALRAMYVVFVLKLLRNTLFYSILYSTLYSSLTTPSSAYLLCSSTQLPPTTSAKSYSNCTSMRKRARLMLYLWRHPVAPMPWACWEKTTATACAM